MEQRLQFNDTQDNNNNNNNNDDNNSNNNIDHNEQQIIACEILKFLRNIELLGVVCDLQSSFIPRFACKNSALLVEWLLDRPNPIRYGVGKREKRKQERDEQKVTERRREEENIDLLLDSVMACVLHVSGEN